MAHPIDLHVGNRVRMRRRFIGMTQQRLAECVRIRFQQIQKYESGANRISASRLWLLSKALGVPITYFFEGVEDNTYVHANVDNEPGADLDVFQNKDTIDLIRAFYTMDDEPRKRLLDLARAMSGDA